ncbi:hypothetical protein AYI70_g6524 [Smittium culicis]|uniref:Uncharacterized protein n=1 Tax=Smittium culicis TaxID=133412 RepID=A0A1R1XPH9_9FUNG|nr:hypothetical protein AYI70_g6524 [Smittium culicis]
MHREAFLVPFAETNTAESSSSSTNPSSLANCSDNTLNPAPVSSCQSVYFSVLFYASVPFHSRFQHPSSAFLRLITKLKPRSYRFSFTADCRLQLHLSFSVLQGCDFYVSGVLLPR